jgi:hypothetical protein
MMKLYTFEYYHPPTDSWRPCFAASEEKILIERGEYLKYTNNFKWVRPWKTIDVNVSPEDLCKLLNGIVETME